MKEKKQRINIKRQIDNNKRRKITTEKQQRNTTQKQVCLLTILASSLLCALFTLFHSHPPPRFPVPSRNDPNIYIYIYIYIPESAQQLEVLIGFPLGKEQRGRVREGEKDYQLRGRPLKYRSHVGFIFCFFEDWDGEKPQCLLTFSIKNMTKLVSGMVKKPQCF